MSNIQFIPLPATAISLHVIEDNDNFTCEIYEINKDKDGRSIVAIVFTPKNSNGNIDYKEVEKKKCLSKSQEWCDKSNCKILGTTTRY